MPHLVEIGGASAHRDLELYGKRFTTEESFRDLKNLRFGIGRGETRISSPSGGT